MASTCTPLALLRARARLRRFWELAYLKTNKPFKHEIRVLGIFHLLVPDGVLRDDPSDGSDRGCSLDQAAARNSALLARHLDADLRRGLGDPDASPPDRHLGIFLRMEAWDARPAVGILFQRGDLHHYGLW